jgi:hypothetical protein
MTVVCDASPLIFLAKLNRLDLITRLLGPEVVVVECVAREVTHIERAGEIERARLEAFLATATVVHYTETTPASARLSTCDRQTLACGEVAQNEEQAGKKHQELHRRQDALDQRPDRGVATNTFLGGVKRRPRFRR